MKAVILCGGQGMRIRDVDETLPKPLLPIGGKPILWHIMKMYSQHGINEFILCLGYKGWKIKEYFFNYHLYHQDFTFDISGKEPIQFHANSCNENWTITFAETGLEAMTGARLREVKKYLDDEETFCVTYGDGVANIDIKEELAFHKKNKLAGTISAVRPLSRFGEISSKGIHVVIFNEKPMHASSWVNGGFFIFSAPLCWKYFDAHANIVLERDVLSTMVKERQLGVYHHEGFWMGMDTIHEYVVLNEMWSSGKAPWKIW